MEHIILKYKADFVKRNVVRKQT